MIQFLLNQQLVELQDSAADLTVLDYLRNQKGLCGSKEGCASGDCGVCTVVIVQRTEQGLSYHNINSCITFIAAVHGRQLITVEHLAEVETLHPVQQAIVNHHGSQCGFCTPGFVMSLFALYKQSNNVKVNRQLVEEYLGGNLCRCTGYRPIIDAAMEVTAAAVPDKFSLEEQTTSLQLQAIPENLIERDSKVSIPNSISELISCLENQPEAKMVGGGTDLALEVTQKLNSFPQLVFLDRVQELLQVQNYSDRLEIGAAVSLVNCKRAIGNHYPQTEELFSRFGSSQIRYQGTIGGNIANASPIGDLPPLLIALNATLKLQKNQVIRELPIDEFFLEYRKTALAKNEFIRSIVIPLPESNQRFSIYKVSKRLEDDISAVCMAISVSQDESDTITTATVALGGMATMPRRAMNCENALVGQIFDQKTIENARLAIATDFNPIDDARASASYRVQITQNLLSRFLIESTQPEIKTRVVNGH